MTKIVDPHSSLSIDLFLPLEQKKKKQPPARKRNVAKKTKR